VPVDVSNARPAVSHAGPSGRATSRGWLVIHPNYAELFAQARLYTPADVLDLPGEVVSGHADRHVVEVRLPGSDELFYLKRQHRVGWRERLRQVVDGFGWSSLCGREARLLARLAANRFACPEWVAHGEDGRGRAFLLVRGLTGSVELRRLLNDDTLTPHDRRRLAERFGQAVAELHDAGFTTPDLTAKHVFVDPATFAIAIIDWQSARTVRRVGLRDRVEALAALHASLDVSTATVGERGRVLWAYLRVARRTGRDGRSFGHFTRRVVARAAVLSARRSIRDQRQPAAKQRLVWLAGEAVCAVPDVAAVWPRPAVAPPFYSTAPTDERTVELVRLPDGRPAHLIRFRTFAPLGRLVARIRGKAWRSPGATAGRVLFHLERYGIPSPRLLAFGQRLTGPCSVESFVLFDVPNGMPLGEWLARPAIPSDECEDVLDQIDLLRRQLAEAGLRPVTGEELFRVEPTGRLVVCPTAVRIASGRTRP
jgi:tRNA A-37 threonylcarbamoyl transferase component Bud32